jgi:hypothetical protein
LAPKKPKHEYGKYRVIYISGGAKKSGTQAFCNKLGTMRRMLILFGTIYLMDISPLLVTFQPYGLNTCKMTGKLKL